MPRALPSSATVRHAFDRHTLDGATVRATLLELVVHLGRRLCCRGQAARALTLTLRFAGGTTWEKTRRLTEPSAHNDDLRTLAYQLMDAAGLQRGRLTGITLKGDALVDADQVAQQISLDTAREARLVAEAAMDRIRDKFGPGMRPRPPPAAPPEPGPLRLERRLRDGCRPLPLSWVNTQSPMNRPSVRGRRPEHEADQR
ncbi:hypothetical protein AB0N12_20885 [Streptomyces albogriseolus]